MEAPVDRRGKEGAEDYNDERVTPASKSLCEGLLQKSPSNRLGCSRGRHGVMEVKIHPWFNSVNWRRMEAGRAKPSFEPDPHAVYAKVGAKIPLGNSILFLFRMFWT